MLHRRVPTPTVKQLHLYTFTIDFDAETELWYIVASGNSATTPIRFIVGQDDDLMSLLARYPISSAP